MYLDDIQKFADHTENMYYLYTQVLNKAKQLPLDIPFVEIGTRAGGTALLFLCAIAESKKPRPLFTIDPYGDKPYKRGKEILCMDYGENFYKIAMKEIAVYLQKSDNLFHYPWKITSLDFMKIYPQIDIWYRGRILKEPFGFVYLDGDHDEDTISKEIEWFSERMHIDGMIVIDDSEHIVDSNNAVIRSFLSKAWSNGNRLYLEIKQFKTKEKK